MKIHQKIDFWSLLGVTGKSRGQEKSIFAVFGHLTIFENFEKLVAKWVGEIEDWVGSIEDWVGNIEDWFGNTKDILLFVENIFILSQIGRRIF